MKNNKRTVHPSIWLVAVTLGLLVADLHATDLSRTDSAEMLKGAAGYSSLQRERSACRRYSVTWSGGVALRGPDRISPRPVRGRWQDAGSGRVRCQGVNGFRQRRVADSPWVR